MPKKRRAYGGNIDLVNRPTVRNPETGGLSTLYSASFGIDGKEVLLPRVSPDGKILSEDEAVQRYFDTGEHLGIFDTPEEAIEAGRLLHEDQERIGRAKRHASTAANREAHLRGLLSQFLTRLGR